MASISIRHSLISRILLLVLLVVFSSGLLTILFSYISTQEQAARDSLAKAEELIDTIEPSAQIACYLNDRQLASEVVKGLLKSQLIFKASVLGSEHELLASGNQDFDIEQDDIHRKSLSRVIHSPFEQDATVGSIEVTLNPEAIHTQIENTLSRVITPVISLIVMAAIAMVFFIFLLLLPRSKQLLEQIRSINVENGETLQINTGDKRTEIGVLVDYINHLIKRMFLSLESERELRHQQEIQKRLYHSILENTRTCIFTFNSKGQLLSSNKACNDCSITNNLKDEVTALNLVEILAGEDPALRETIEIAMINQEEVQFDMPLARDEKHPVRWIQVNLTPIEEDILQGVINDITELKTESQQAHQAARIDVLTQAANRLGMNEKLADCLEDVKQGDLALTLMMIDLDHFKWVNDNLGHDAGDLVLVQVTQRIKNMVRESDFVARLGGDEFVILLKNAPRNVAERIAGDLVSSLSSPIVLENDKTANIGASIGIFAAEPGSVFSAADILKYADEQMYQIKRSGRNNYGFFEPGDSENKIDIDTEQ